MAPQLLFFPLNGAGTLLLETFWLKKQLMLFGNSPGSYGSILFVYFIGVSLGSYIFGRKIPKRFSKPILYVCFSCAILFSFFFPYFLLEASPFFSHALIQNLLVYSVLKWTIAVIALLPVCFFLGAFFPLVAQTVPNNSFVLLYGIQAFGALVGTYFGSFFLPYHWGYRVTFAVALIVNLLSLVAFQFINPKKESAPAVSSSILPEIRHQILALIGGFIACTLQVVWIRFITIGTDNSIYAFGSVSIIILVLITIASWLVSRLPEQWFGNHHLINAIIGCSLIGLIVSTWIFVRQTHGLQLIMVEQTFGFFKCFGFALPFVIAGYLFPSLLFPFVLRLRYGKKDGHFSSTANAGILIGMNSLGCGLGSLLGSFIFLPRFGIWMTVLLCMAAYALAPLLLDNAKIRIASVVAGAALLLMGNPLSYPLVTPIDPLTHSSATLVSVKEGKYGIVSVIDNPDGARTLWLNNSYILEAGMGNVQGTRRMGILPVLLGPDSADLAMIGIGTGITASGFLNSDLKSMTLVELIPEVKMFAQKYFGNFNRNILKDPRVTAVTSDGRQFMKTTRQKYDIIVSDLFTPWNEGTSYLYTTDHFAVVKSRLNPDGLFCLWLPLYQLTSVEVRIIMKSFATVFPVSTIWELDASTDVAALALIGSNRAFDIPRLQAHFATHRSLIAGIKPDIIELHESGLFCRYVAPIDLPDRQWSDIPVNTLDKPVLEFVTAQKGRILLKDQPFISFIDSFYTLPSNPGSRYFSVFTSDMEQWRKSGIILNQYYTAWHAGEQIKAAELYKQAEQLTPALTLVKQLQ
jgi:spermidine synthase